MFHFESGGTHFKWLFPPELATEAKLPMFQSSCVVSLLTRGSHHICSLKQSLQTTWGYLRSGQVSMFQHLTFTIFYHLSKFKNFEVTFETDLIFFLKFRSIKLSRNSNTRGYPIQVWVPWRGGSTILNELCCPQTRAQLQKNKSAPVFAKSRAGLH